MKNLKFSIVSLLIGVLFFHTFMLSGQELTILRMFELADSNNTSIQAYATEVAEARAAINEARNGYLPTMDATLSFSYNGDGTITDRNFSNAFTADIPAFGNNLTVQVSQVIFAGGAINSGVKISELQSELAISNAESNRQSVRYMLVGNYLELCKIENQLLVFDSHIAQTQKMLEDMRSRFEEGTAIQNDITRYELQLHNLEYQRIQLRNTKRITNIQLARALGLPLNAEIKPIAGQYYLGDQALSSHSDLFATDSDAQYWQDMASSNSYALKNAALGVQISKYAEKITNSERYPKIAFVAAEHLDGPIVIDIPAIDKNFNYWYVGVGIKYNFANLWTVGRKMKTKQLAVHKAQQQQVVAQEHIQTAVDAAYIRYQEAYALLETKQKSEMLALQNFEVVSYRYENGLALITDLLDASSQKLDAELQVVNAKVNIDFAYYTLKHITGTL